MALLVIQAQGNNKGDILEVREENAPFGKLECLPKFLMIKIEGSVSELKYLMDSQEEDQPEFVQVDSDNPEDWLVQPDLILINKHRYKFDVDDYLSEEHLAEIELSNWLIDTYEIDAIIDKAI